MVRADSVGLYELDEMSLSKMADEFHREGCVVIRNVLTAEEVEVLRAKTDEFALKPDPASKHTSYAGNAFVLRYCERLDPLFKAMTAHERILKVVHAVMGPDVAFNAMNVIRNGRDQAISNWHVDDAVEFPLPPSVPRFDARMRMPVLWMTVQVALSDIDRDEHGPTQYVPGSHYSGRKPNDSLVFEGRGPQSVYCKAGDIYLTNHQCWHRGGPNQSDRVRYLMQVQYALGWADRRFKGFG